MREIWRDIINYEKIYQVSSLGRIRGLDRIVNSPWLKGRRQNGMMIKCKNDKDGYIVVDLHKNNKFKTVKVHRLVAEAFIKNPKSKPEVNHIDGIKSNNLIGNLEWCTSKENGEHASLMGLKHGVKGEKNINSKLKWKDIELIRQSKNSRKLLATKFNVCRQSIDNVINNKGWINN